MKCEKCNKEHDGSYGSGRFCSSKCARSFATNNDSQNELKDAICPKCGKEHKIRKRAAPKLTPCIDCGGNDPTIKRDKVKYCLYCGKKLERGRIKYCCYDCKTIYDCLIYINKWKLGIVDGIVSKYEVSSHIRRYLFKKHNYSCSKCGYNDVHPITKLPILDIHHIDGNCLNNKEENLDVLCPNCHRKTDNFGSRNKNNIVSRKERLYL